MVYRWCIMMYLYSQWFIWFIGDIIIYKGFKLCLINLWFIGDIYIYIYSQWDYDQYLWLVCGDWNMNFMFGTLIIPTDWLIFFRGVAQPPSSSFFGSIFGTVPGLYQSIRIYLWNSCGLTSWLSNGTLMEFQLDFDGKFHLVILDILYYMGTDITLW